MGKIKSVSEAIEAIRTCDEYYYEGDSNCPRTPQWVIDDAKEAGDYLHNIQNVLEILKEHFKGTTFHKCIIAEAEDDCPPYATTLHFGKENAKKIKEWLNE